ncbi:MAG: homocysteine biosynthesis protein, partial [Candidatus Thorarchaeota archaeon]
MEQKDKTVQEINERIQDGNARVVTASEMTELVAEMGADGAAHEVDVVTTGTFGAMCSSGMWMNFGHSEPPMKMSRVWLNDVEAYGGVAAVDAYLGATQLSESLGMEYGGGHVIEDLVRRKPVHLRAEADGTDCYPRKQLSVDVSIDDMNQATLSNPRNCYERYAVATNSTGKTLYTYMGKLLPNMGNATFSGAGELSPVVNDPRYRTIGIGTRIFLGGADGYVIGNGTQHSPENGFGTLMVQGDLKGMSSEFINGAT